jgi:hypothetical protein
MKSLGVHKCKSKDEFKPSKNNKGHAQMFGSLLVLLNWMWLLTSFSIPIKVYSPLDFFNKFLK